MAPALHDVPTALGTIRWHGFPPLTAWFFRNTVWRAVSAFEMPRADAGCRSDAHEPNHAEQRDQETRQARPPGRGSTGMDRIRMHRCFLSQPQRDWQITTA